MKGPIEYQTPANQEWLLRYGSRQQLIDWLRWNDPNGMYTDEDSATEGRPPLTLAAARQIMQEQLSR